MSYEEADIIALVFPDTTLYSMRPMLVSNFRTIANYLSLDPDNREIDLSAIKIDAVRNLLLLIDTDKKIYGRDNVYDVIVAADYLEFSGFRARSIAKYIMQYISMNHKISSLDDLIKVLTIASWVDETIPGIFPYYYGRREIAEAAKNFVYDNLLDPEEALYEYEGAFSVSNNRFDFKAALAEVIG